MEHLKEQYPGLYFVSSTTKVLTDFTQLEEEIRRKDFHYVVPDFRLNKAFDKLNTLSQAEKDKVEFLCNECCWFGCRDRKACYETVSRKNLGENCPEHYCKAPEGERGYLFQKLWRIRDLLESMISGISICQWDFQILKSKDGASEVL